VGRAQALLVVWTPPQLIAESGKDPAGKAVWVAFHRTLQLLTHLGFKLCDMAPQTAAPTAAAAGVAPRLLVLLQGGACRSHQHTAISTL
jgi:hypothetical protein